MALAILATMTFHEPIYAHGGQHHIIIMRQIDFWQTLRPPITHCGAVTVPDCDLCRGGYRMCAPTIITAISGRQVRVRICSDCQKMQSREYKARLAAYAAVGHSLRRYLISDIIRYIFLFIVKIN